MGTAIIPAPNLNVKKTDIVNNLTSQETQKPLSAAQGKALNEAIAQSTAYHIGDTFGSRQWRAMGRVINSGKGIYCWFDLGKPIIANGATITLGSINVYGLSSGTFTPAGTVSSITVSGNELIFVVDTTTSHTPGDVCLLEFNNTSLTLT